MVAHASSSGQPIAFPPVEGDQADLRVRESQLDILSFLLVEHGLRHIEILSPDPETLLLAYKLREWGREENRRIRIKLLPGFDHNSFWDRVLPSLDTVVGVPKSAKSV